MEKPRSKELARLIVDMLVEARIISPQHIARAAEIVASEIEIRKRMGVL